MRVKTDANHIEQSGRFDRDHGRKLQKHETAEAFRFGGAAETKVWFPYGAEDLRTYSHFAVSALSR